ncbi:MAG: sigma 54-interacting transcriptional regulator [Ottowia sp.]|uniref:sigma 54-interacting transcriptional regulator n=1 Tax=Ottowia sp. TaxID=1898956 RepID=UPI003C779FF5
MPDPSMPGDQDLRRLVQFSSSDGRIWLAGQRMLLVHAAALKSLRRELIHTLGPSATRRLLLRAGFAAGEQDAALARQIRAGRPLHEMFAVGPQLHMLEGAVQVTPELMELDPAAGTFHGIFRWDHSWEVETHVRDFGPQTEPVCWMLLGYASGYTTGFMGRPVLFKEVACAACGAASCRIEGRPVADWPDGEQLARDYDPDSMLLKLESLASQVESLRSSLQAADDLGPLVGQSRPFAQALELLRKAAGTNVTVLLTGETGVGKERFARGLHAMSARKDKPFIAVNCAALPGDLIESELFGAEKGAYTGSAASRPGRFERADGGTLFLDELGELPLSAQAKLLRVLQDGAVERLGATQARKVNVRIVAATNVDLAAAVKSGRFRQDLMYRIDVYPIHIPALRERPDDVELLARHLLQRFTTLHEKAVAGFTDRALDALRHHDWPGNVRELENLVERGVILAGTGEMVDEGDLFPSSPRRGELTVNQAGQLEQCLHGPAATLAQNALGQGVRLDDLESALIQAAVTASEGNLSAAARTLGLTRPQLSYRLDRIKAKEAGSALS